jgi:hypothetical protein
VYRSIADLTARLQQHLPDADALHMEMHAHEPRSELPFWRSGLTCLCDQDHRIGPDIPNVNTIIINRDRFGMANSTSCAAGSGDNVQAQSTRHPARVGVSTAVDRLGSNPRCGIQIRGHMPGSTAALLNNGETHRILTKLYAR